MKIKRIYLCARYGRREELAAVAEKLRNLGFEVVSRWLEVPASCDDGGPVSTIEDPLTAMYRDYEDIEMADTFVAFTEDPAVTIRGAQRGGRHHETGYAVKAGKKVVVVGPRENLFHVDPNIRQFDTADKLFQALVLGEL